MKPGNFQSKHEHGPFDIIGDVHGCFDELYRLLEKLGYQITRKEPTFNDYGFLVTHPTGRKLVFVGDLVDRGPKVVPVLKLAMSMVYTGIALCIPGNHDEKLLRKLNGRNVQVKHGLEVSVNQLAEESTDFSQAVREFLSTLPNYLILDDGKLIIAHAGMKEGLQGSDSTESRQFSLYGETTGETDEFGLPVRLNWAIEYKGKPVVVYGHTPVPQAIWLNNTIDIDTGCVFGGKLTALRYPEQELVDIPTFFTYYEPARPFLPEASQAPDLSEV